MRRGSIKINPLLTALAIVIFLSISSLGYFIFARSSDPFKGIEKLDVISYVDSAKTFQGGVFWIEGTVDEVLKAKSGYGKLVSIAVSTSHGVNVIPLLVPLSFNSFNLQKGQNLKIKVRGIDSGLLKAENIEKSS